jgi:hypothetical protein
MEAHRRGDRVIPEITMVDDNIIASETTQPAFEEPRQLNRVQPEES